MRERVVTSEIVEVLLATFNGESFLREQIDSVLTQDYPHLRVLARDDGSSDGTVEILKDYQKRFPDRVRLLPTDKPTGSPKRNFLKLMHASSADYVCFCDQDDVWLPDKVSITMKAMHDLELKWERSMPCLVFTDLQLVDAELATLHRSFWEFMNVDPGSVDRLNRLLMVCVVTGCTAVINRPLLELAKRMPDEAAMHDRWIGLIAATMGKSMIIRNQTVLYRQHGRNLLGTGQDPTLGVPVGEKRSIWKCVRECRQGVIFSDWKIAQEQAAAFVAVYGGELSFEMRRIIDGFRTCDVDHRRLARILTMIRFGFYHRSLHENLEKLAILWTSR